MKIDYYRHPHHTIPPTAIAQLPLSQPFQSQPQQPAKSYVSNGIISSHSITLLPSSYYTYFLTYYHYSHIIESIKTQKPLPYPPTKDSSRPLKDANQPSSILLNKSSYPTNTSKYPATTNNPLQRPTTSIPTTTLELRVDKENIPLRSAPSSILSKYDSPPFDPC